MAYKSVDPRPDFPKREELQLEDWYRRGIDKQYLNKNKNSKKRFSFLDGPITANNPMGVHHAWGRTYKDLWQRFFNLHGYKQRFQNGFDCQGLWVEVEVEKELKLKNKKDIENLIKGDITASITYFVSLCKARVEKYAKIQTEQSKRLGYFMDWDNSYFTMSDENNYMIWYFLKKCHDNGWIYKGKEAVPWCPRCETAISQHEMLTEDYREITHEAIVLELPLLGESNEYLLVWTTTPWTIPANVAVAVDRDSNYVLTEGTTGDRYWVVEERKEAIMGKDAKVIKRVRGENLVGLRYKGPFDHLSRVKISTKGNTMFHTVVATDSQILPVSVEEGTGLIHIAPGAGTNDYRLGRIRNLPVIEVIEDDASFKEGLDFLSGKNGKNNPSLILDHLIDRDRNGENWVFEISEYTHRYPACWRCKEELVWKVTDEWYVAMDTKGSATKRTFREMMKENAKKIVWMPSFGKKRELDWLENMQDWLISKKNRYWGLALPIFECAKCNKFEVIGGRDELENRSVKGWDVFMGKSPHKPWIDKLHIECRDCDGVMKRVDDVGNPWLDAGIVPFSTITEKNTGVPLYTQKKNEWVKWFPAHFITESFPGQFKNWFYALIAMSTVLEDTHPFKRVLGFATLLDETGRPMHKSWGNSIAFEEGASKIGVDVMRWMYVNHTPEENLLFGYKRADEIRRRFYLMLWNMYRYFVEYADLDGFDHRNITDIKLSVLDKWMRNRLYETVYAVERHLKKYHAKHASEEIEALTTDVSRWYIRRSRNRLWSNSANKHDKGAFYATLHEVLKTLSIILSPFTPFIADEIYSNLTHGSTVHTANWPKIQEQVDNELNEDMKLVREICEIGNRIRKEKGIKLRQPLQDATIILGKDRFFLKKKLLKEYLTLIEYELNVKRVLINVKDKGITVLLNVHITKDLKDEGRVRELIRKIQEERKKLNLSARDMINVTLPIFPLKFKDEITRTILAQDVKIGTKIKVTPC